MSRISPLKDAYTLTWKSAIFKSPQGYDERDWAIKTSIPCKLYLFKGWMELHACESTKKPSNHNESPILSGSILETHCVTSLFRQCPFCSSMDGPPHKQTTRFLPKQHRVPLPHRKAERSGVDFECHQTGETPRLPLPLQRHSSMPENRVGAAWHFFGGW